jgi:hypothetical protein
MNDPDGSLSRITRWIPVVERLHHARWSGMGGRITGRVPREGLDEH